MTITEKVRKKSFFFGKTGWVLVPGLPETPGCQYINEMLKTAIKPEQPIYYMTDLDKIDQTFFLYYQVWSSKFLSFAVILCHLLDLVTCNISRSFSQTVTALHKSQFTDFDFWLTKHQIRKTVISCVLRLQSIDSSSWQTRHLELLTDDSYLPLADHSKEEVPQKVVHLLVNVFWTFLIGEDRSR